MYSKEMFSEKYEYIISNFVKVICFESEMRPIKSGKKRGEFENHRSSRNYYIEREKYKYIF